MSHHTCIVFRKSRNSFYRNLFNIESIYTMAYYPYSRGTLPLLQTENRLGGLFNEYQELNDLSYRNQSNYYRNMSDNCCCKRNNHHREHPPLPPPLPVPIPIFNPLFNSLPFYRPPYYPFYSPFFY